MDEINKEGTVFQEYNVYMHVKKGATLSIMDSQPKCDNLHKLFLEGHPKIKFEYNRVELRKKFI